MKPCSDPTVPEFVKGSHVEDSRIRLPLTKWSWGSADNTGRAFDANRIDVVVCSSRKSPFHGVVLGEEALVLDFRTFTSFRVQSGNFGFIPGLHFAKRKNSLDKEYLAQYFKENRDNPYAIQHVVTALLKEQPIRNLTQYPPLLVSYSSQREWLRQLEAACSLAAPADIVFSTAYGSSISSLIRRYDRCMFSHCAIYIGERRVSEISTTGGLISDLANSTPGSRIAFYRPRGEISQTQRHAIVTNSLRLGIRANSYPFFRLFSLYLRKQWRLPVAKKSLTNADLLYSNTLELVSYV